MGLYISSFDLSELDHYAADGFSIVNRHLQSAGFPSLDEIAPPGLGFEEKLSVEPSSFEELCDNFLPGFPMDSLTLPSIASDYLFPVEGAALILPFPFRGLMEVPDLFQTETFGIASAQQLKIQIEAMTEETGFSLEAAPELSPGGYVFNGWYDAMTSPEYPESFADPSDPDTMFHLALYRAVADYCIRRNSAVRISQ